MRRFLLPACLALTAAACSPATQAPSPTAAQKPVDPLAPRLATINDAQVATTAPATPATASANAPPDLGLVRVEVLLDRARFSPGVVDGRQGSNLQHALAAFQTAHQLSATGAVDAATWAALSGEPGAAAPATQAYTITPQDLAGPFAPDVGEDMVKLAAQDQGPQYATLLEALAERFHMSQALLTQLNPGVDFKTAGARIIVADATPPALQKGDVDHIEVSKAHASVLAYGQNDQVIAFYPATVGSTERPSPSGTHKVNGVARNPTYTYDPAKLHWGPRSHGKLVIKPGPNNPVGLVWIDLNAPSYGIHGSPDPETIGKTASHGCVRLTNWDAEGLAAGVKPGVTVTFEGSRGDG